MVAELWFITISIILAVFSFGYFSCVIIVLAAGVRSCGCGSAILWLQECGFVVEELVDGVASEKLVVITVALEKLVVDTEVRPGDIIRVDKN